MSNQINENIVETLFRIKKEYDERFHYDKTCRYAISIEYNGLVKQILDNQEIVDRLQSQIYTDINFCMCFDKRSCSYCHDRKRLEEIKNPPTNKT